MPTKTKTPKALSAATITGLTALANNVLAESKGYDQSLFLSEDGTCGCLAHRHCQLTVGLVQYKRLVTRHKQWCVLPGSSNPFYNLAKKSLGLTHQQAKDLFGHAWAWPLKFRLQYESAKTSRGRARAAYNRIMFFLKTNGTDTTSAAAAA